jgi:NAD+ synthase|tara:strand:+ start:57 stop:797 length:741 start_codon:yes stop_codon:yes gene_type:complete
MNRIEDYNVLKNRIVKWIKGYADTNNLQALVVGVSGGIDSAVVSTLCAETKLPTFVLGMPIHQDASQESLSDNHLAGLDKKYNNVKSLKFDLTKTFETFKKTLNEYSHDEHVLANTRSRLRMVTLYQIAGKYNGIVVGTGNKVEDYGVGFYTKYGDGGVDIAPIADLYKTEVRELGGYLGVMPEIIDATPTDGLWDDKRTDEDQLGVSYTVLEEAMQSGIGPGVDTLYRFNKMNQHKMEPIPTFKL